MNKMYNVLIINVNFTEEICFLFTNCVNVLQLLVLIFYLIFVLLSNIYTRLMLNYLKNLEMDRMEHLNLIYFPTVYQRLNL